jgi:hypothetical protein
VREGEIIYMLPEASRPKAGQIGLAGQICLAGQIGLAQARLLFLRHRYRIDIVSILYRISQYCKDQYRIDLISISHRFYPAPS